MKYDDRENRRVTLNLAKTFLYKRTPSIEEMDFIISTLEDMPGLSYKGLGILVKLKERRDNLFGDNLFG